MNNDYYKDLLIEYKCNTGESIADLSKQNKILLVFVRHSGCCFCRQTLEQLSNSRLQLLSNNIVPVVVHMGGTHEEIFDLLQKYNLENLKTVSDPSCNLYKAFNFARGNITQLFGFNVIKQALVSLFKNNHGIGKLNGDGFQLGGAVVIHNSEMIYHYPTKDAADSIPFDEVNSSCSIQ